MNNFKKLNILLLALTIFVYTAGYLYWYTYCIPGNCTYSLRNELLRPISIGSLYISGFLLILLFLPPQYFKNWLKYIFSWGFPLVVYLTYITTGSSSIPAYGKVDVVNFWGVVFGFISLAFVIAYYFRHRKQK